MASKHLKPTVNLHCSSTAVGNFSKEEDELALSQCGYPQLLLKEMPQLHIPRFELSIEFKRWDKARNELHGSILVQLDLLRPLQTRWGNLLCEQLLATLKLSHFENDRITSATGLPSTLLCYFPYRRTGQALREGAVFASSQAVTICRNKCGMEEFLNCNCLGFVIENSILNDLKIINVVKCEIK